MIIENGVLIKVDVEDIDENGKVVVPSGVERVFSEAFIDLFDVKEIVFNEGLESVDGLSLVDLPNLKRVEFPQSLKNLGGENNYVTSEVFNTPNLELVLKSYPRFSKDCFSRQQTIDYIKRCLVDIEKNLNSADSKDLEKAMECYNSIIYHKKSYKKTNPELLEEFDRISMLLIAKLQQVKNGKRIGDEMIENCLKNNKILTPAMLQYDAYMVAVNGLKLAKSYKLVDFTFCEKTAMLVDDTNAIEFDADAMSRRVQKLTKNKNVKPLDQNLVMMHVIRHELSHLYHKTLNKNSKNEDEIIAYLDREVQHADDGYVTGNQTWHIASHDFMPDEIDADIRGLTLLENDLIKFYGFKERATKAYIEKHKQARMQMVYDKYNIDENDNYRVEILEEALNSGRLSATEQTKIGKILDEYSKLEKSIVL